MSINAYPSPPGFRTLVPPSEEVSSSGDDFKVGYLHAPSVQTGDSTATAKISRMAYMVQLVSRRDRTYQVLVDSQMSKTGRHTTDFNLTVSIRRYGTGPEQAPIVCAHAPKNSLLHGTDSRLSWREVFPLIFPTDVATVAEGPGFDLLGTAGHAGRLRHVRPLTRSDRASGSFVATAGASSILPPVIITRGVQHLIAHRQLDEFRRRSNDPMTREY